MLNTTLQKLRAKRKLSKRADDQAATGSKLLQDGQVSSSSRYILHPALLLSPVATVEPPRTQVTNLSTPCSLCDVVVHVGSMRFEVLEPPRTST